jgi:small-conductance mechanosensitive channel
MKLLIEAWDQNTVPQWALAGLLAFVSLLLLMLAHALAERVLKAISDQGRTAPLHRVLAQGLAATKLWLLFPMCLTVGASALDLPPKLDRIVDNIAVLALLLQSAFWLSGFATYWLSGEIERRRGNDSEAVTALALIEFGVRVLVWTVILLVILNHLNFNISALVTGLGVGGVAVALAAQSILSDLFASLSIVLDKPFVVGDFIIVDDYLGTVEHVGVKTTRIRSLGGELIVFSNADLLKSRIRNYKRMYERRAQFTIAVAYDTQADQLAAIPGMLREAILANDTVRFDRAHFKEYGESALVFEVAYFVLSPDNNLYMDIQQAINLTIMRRFRKEGIDFAHPLRVVRIGAGAAPRGQNQGKQREERTWTADAIA